MVDLAVVGIELQTAQFAEGVATVETGTRKMESALLKTQATVGATGKVFDQVAQQSIKAAQAGAQQARASQEATGWFEKEAAAIRAKSSVMLSEFQVYQQVKAALETRVAAGRAMVSQEQRERAETEALVTSNTKYLASLDAVRAAITRKHQADQQLVAAQFATAQSLQKVGTAATATLPGLRTMSTGLASLALSEVGARAGLGSLVSTLSFFALGSLTSFGVIAGLTAIAFLISKITEASRLGKKDMEEFLERGRRLADQNRTPAQERSGLVAEQQRATQEIEKQEAALKRVYGEFQRLRSLGQGNSLFGTALQGSAQQIADSLRDLRAAARGFGSEVGKIDEETATKAKQAREEAAQAAKARLGEVQKLQDAELAAIEATARFRRDTRALESALIERARVAIERQVSGSERLTAAEKDRLRVALQLQAAAEAELRARAAALAVPKLTLAPTQQEAFLKEFNPFGKTTVGRPQSTELFSRDDAIVILAAAREKSLDKIEEQARRLKRLLIEELGQAFRSVFSGASDDVQRLVGDLEQAAHSIASMISRAKELGLSFKIGEGFSGKGSTLLNLGAGAQVGSAIGAGTGSAAAGIFGGAAAGFATGGPLGAAAGIVTGFFSALGGGAEKARAAAEAQQKYNQDLKDFAAIAHPRGALGAALDGIEKEFVRLAAGVAAATGVTQKAPVDRLTQEIIRVNLAASAGSAGLEAYWREMLRLRQITDENIAATKARIALEQADLNQDLTVRALVAQERDAEAEAEAFRLRQAREFAAVVDQFKGTFTEAEKAAFDATVANLEYTQSLEAAAFAAAQAAAAAQKAFDDAQTVADIQAKILENTGKTKDAAAAREAIRIARELHDAQLLVDQGIITQQMFNDLADSFEVLAEATAAATAAAEAQAAFQKAQTARGIDAETAGLTGDTAGAARINEEIRQATERNRVRQLFDQGVITGAQFNAWTAAFNQSLTQVTEATEAMTRARSGSDIGLTVARTITGVQADTMTSYLATISFNTSRLVELQSGAPVGSVGLRGALSATGQNFGGTTPSQVTMHFGGGITIRAAPGETAGQALDRWVDQKIGTGLSLRREASGITPSA